MLTDAATAGIRVTITDNGAGFPEQLMQRAFEPYMTTKPKGTGLGLAIVKMFIEAHGGTVSVESEVGRGSTFRFLLPAKP